jgi:hypothetical protein
VLVADWTSATQTILFFFTLFLFRHLPTSFSISREREKKEEKKKYVSGSDENHSKKSGRISNRRIEARHCKPANEEICFVSPCRV